MAFNVSSALQADILTNYLVHRPATNKVKELYELTVSKAPSSSKFETKVLHFAFKYPVLMGSLDSALALVSGEAELRRQIYYMFAILEATPEYADDFLPKKQNKYYVIYLIWVGIKATGQIIIGLPLLKLLEIGT